MMTQKNQRCASIDARIGLRRQVLELRAAARGAVLCLSQN